MRLLYVIGNGLDIAHHMSTSYQDFIAHYLRLKTSDEDIQSMKKDIGFHQYDKWSDLEIGFGQYSSQCATKEIFLKCLTDLKFALKSYLKEESKKILEYKIQSYQNFVYPSALLEPEPKEKYNRYTVYHNTDNVSIDVITLNYTNTLELLMNYNNAKQSLTRGTILNSIFHIHGTLDDMMVMGVNDSTQISNSLFAEDEDVIEDFIKPEYNDACMNNKNVICQNLIDAADVIVIYGASLGLSDEKWWRMIGARMSTDKYPLLIYLPYDDKKNLYAEPNRLRRWTRDYVANIKKKFDIKLEDKVLSNRICVAINKTLFPIIKNNSVSKVSGTSK